MKISKKTVTYYEVECGLIPVSTDKKKPIRAQFGIKADKYTYLLESDKTRSRVSYFLNYRSLGKLLVDKPTTPYRYTQTCVVCEQQSAFIFTGRMTKPGIMRSETYLNNKFIHVVKHEGQTYLLYTCSRSCYDIYDLNPLGYDLNKIYGKQSNS